MFSYFVSYSYACHNGSGFGACGYNTAKPLTQWNLISDMIKTIEESNNIQSVVPLNFILMSSPSETKDDK